VNKPQGLLSYTQSDEGTQSWGEIGVVSSGVEGDFDGTAPVDNLLDLVYAPKTRYRSQAAFVMNRRTLSVIRKFKDADGNYMPDIGTDTTPIAFGDFKRGYLIVDRQGIRVLRDPYSAKPYVLFYTTKRVGGGVQDFNAIKLLKLSA